MIFVTGGTGLIGGHLLYELASSGNRIRALKRKSSDLQRVKNTFAYYAVDPELLFSRIDWVDGDLLDNVALEPLLEGITEVYHCAAIVSFQTQDRYEIIHNNREGTANIINASIRNGVKKFCHVSSVAALGTTTEGRLTDENSSRETTKKHTGYSESKFFSEAEVWRGIEEGLDSIIVNPSIVLGPGDLNSGSTQLFKTIKNGQKFYPEGGTGFVGVHDVVRAMTQLMSESNFEANKNQRYILNAENLSYRELFNRIADAMNKPRPRFFASRTMLELAWRASALQAFFTGKAAAITREAAASAANKTMFDGSKITRTIPFEYQSIDQTIAQTVKLLQTNRPKK